MTHERPSSVMVHVPPLDLAARQVKCDAADKWQVALVVRNVSFCYVLLSTSSELVTRSQRHYSNGCGFW
ncbi:hypothetical protein J6590_029962 [Homalodisca vitripennis]|nr:hypothetical protein J6590_029962 [Homalodisca vitripennis]